MNTYVFLTLSTVVTFIVLLALLRLIGSTQLSQLTYFNWVAGACMGNVAANMMAAGTTRDWLHACFSLVVFTLSCILAAFVALKSRFFRRMANSEPIVLIHKGKILRDNLAKSKVNMDILMMLLREKGFFAYDYIEFGILEPSGNLSILPAEETQSVSKADLAYGPDMSNKGEGPYVELVLDGQIDEDKLKTTDYDQEWLLSQVKKHGGRHISQVMFLGVNKQGEVVVDLNREEQEKSPEVE